MTDASAAAVSWEKEYERGRYLDEEPVEFVSDIVRAAADAGLSLARGLYVGCGNGRNLIPLVDTGLDLVGLDISENAIAQLRARRPDRADRLRVGDVAGLAPDESFPVVIGIQVFQHGSRKAAHEHIRRAQARVAPGGLFCLRVNSSHTDVWPDHEVVEFGSDGDFTVRYSAGPKSGLAVHFFTREELDWLFGEAFEPVLPLRLHSTRRAEPAQGQWSQWEGIWRRSR